MTFQQSHQIQCDNRPGPGNVPVSRDQTNPNLHRRSKVHKPKIFHICERLQSVCSSHCS